MYGASGKKRKLNGLNVNSVSVVPPSLQYARDIPEAIDADARILKCTPTIGNQNVSPGGQIIFEFASSDIYDFRRAVLYFTAVTNGGGTFNRFPMFMSGIFSRMYVVFDGLTVEDIVNYGHIATLLEARFQTINSAVALNPVQGVGTTPTFAESYFALMTGGFLSEATRDAIDTTNTRYAIPIHLASLTQKPIPLQFARGSKLQIFMYLDTAANVLESDNGAATFTLSNIEMHVPVYNVSDLVFQQIFGNSLDEGPVVIRFPYWWSNQTSFTGSEINLQITQKTQNMKGAMLVVRLPAALNTLATKNKKYASRFATNTKYSMRINNVNIPPDNIDATQGVIPFYHYMHFGDRWRAYNGNDISTTATITATNWVADSTEGCYLQCVDLESFPDSTAVSGKDTETMTSQAEFRSSVANATYILDLWVLTEAVLMMKKKGDKICWEVNY